MVSDSGFYEGVCGSKVVDLMAVFALVVFSADVCRMACRRVFVFLFFVLGVDFLMEVPSFWMMCAFWLSSNAVFSISVRRFFAFGSAMGIMSSTRFSRLRVIQSAEAMNSSGDPPLWK